MENEFLKQLSKQVRFQQLLLQIEKAYQTDIVYPPRNQVFRVLEECDLEKVKVVILGQDPYHQPNQANGLAFSVNSGMPLPKSLVNIFKELRDDLGICNIDGDLDKWVQQGVLLLNTTLTVIKDKPLSHVNFDYNVIIENVFDYLNKYNNFVIFVLWGKVAQKYQNLINIQKHLILQSAHPSPLSAYRGFFGSKPFSKINHILMERGYQPIDWSNNV